MTTQLAPTAPTLARPLTRPARPVSSQLMHLVSETPVHLALLLIGALWLVPTVGLFVTSFRTRIDILSSGWWTSFLDARYTPENYIRVITSRGTTEALSSNFINSFVVTIPSTILPVVLASLAAYAFAWLNFRGRDWIFLGIVALLVVPIQMTFVPVLQLFNLLKLTGSFVGIWVAHTAYGLPFAIYLLRGFFVALPRDLLEAAKMDGASELRVFTRVVIPLSVPVLASLCIFQFLWVWNDLLVALIYLQSPELQPMTVGVSNLLSTYGVEWELLSAGAFLTMIVPLVVFFSLQRYFVQGLLAGSVKS